MMLHESPSPIVYPMMYGIILWHEDNSGQNQVLRTEMLFCAYSKGHSRGCVHED